MLNIKNQKLNVKKWPWFGYFLIFGITFIVFLYILIPPGIIGPDSFYHTKVALMIKEQGLIQNFPWLQFTTYKDLFVDHHFAYHYLLIPFLKIPTPKNLDIFSAEIDPLIKTKLATAFFAAMVFVIMYWFLRRLRVKAPVFWTLTALLLSQFLIRLSLTRAPAISIIILILGFYFILNKKYIYLFLLSFFYVWIYGAWPLMLVMVIIYCFASTIKLTIASNQKMSINPKSEIRNPKQYQNPNVQNSKQFRISHFGHSNLFRVLIFVLRIFKTFFNKINIKLLLACTAGLTAGLIINPYFPKTLPFYWFQTVKIAILNYHSQIGVGAEWYPPEPLHLFITILPILIFWIIAVAWFINDAKKQKKQAWFLLFVSVFFLLYTLKGRRNVEYFIPPAIFFSSLMFSQISKKINWNRIKNQLKKLLTESENIFYFLGIVFFSALTLFFLIFYVNFSIAKLHTSHKTEARPINHLQMASCWLKNNTQPGEIIFQSSWDIFPELFYFNTHNYYINGLDQTFMYEKDKDTYESWADLVFNKTNPNKTAEVLKDVFNASYVLLDKKHESFAKLLKRSDPQRKSGLGVEGPFLEKVYEDQEAIIFKNMTSSES